MTGNTEFEKILYENVDADTVLIQMADDHDLALIDKEISHIRELTGGKDFLLAAVKVKNWNTDLSPWAAPPVFGEEAFGSGAAETLQYLTEQLIPSLGGCSPSGGRRFLLGGYSLAGLFAIWSAYQTSLFSGVAAASPSVWFPGFCDYVQQNRIHTEAVYLSLGDREERTKNPVMSKVGTAIRTIHACLDTAGIPCTLEWNKGNHFKNPDLRTAKAFSWLMDACQGDGSLDTVLTPDTLLSEEPSL